MASVAFNGENRRGKAFLFLISCGFVGLFPYWIPTSLNLVPAFIFAFFLGTYGLGIVLHQKNYRLNELGLSSINNDDYHSLPSIDVLVSARDEENVVETLVKRIMSIK